MQAAVCHEFGKPLTLENIAIAAPLQGEVLVKLAATAICHSDIHDIKGDLPGPLPFVGGHESAGYVEAVGPGVSYVKPGDAVMATLLSSCGKCRWCLKGLTHLCENVFAKPQGIRLTDGQGKPVIQKAGVGGFAEYILVYETQIVKVPDGIPLDRAALLSCGVMTGFGAVVNRAKVPALSSVVVIGTGGVGLNALQAAAFSGADPVIAVDVVDSKLEDSKKFGATHGVNARSADAAEQVKAITGGQGADFVFVTVGSAAAIKQGFAMSGVRGTTVIVGIPPATETFTFSAFDFLTSERVLTAGFMGSTNIKSDMPKLFSLYKSGKLKLDELITNRYPLAQINEAIENTIQGKALRNVIIFK